MPQVILEYSDNVKLADHKSLFLLLHNILAETLPTKISSCKSRAVVCQNYFLGDGNANNGFVHLSVGVLKGRSEETLAATANKLLEALSNFLDDQMKSINIDISIAISELPATYISKSSSVALKQI